MNNQLIKETALGRELVFPKNYILNLKDKESGASLEDILKSFNMYFLSYTGNTAQTRCQVPKDLRKEGLWITYVTFNHTVVIEWYNSDNIDDATWGSDTYWRQGSNKLVGDISISMNGNWVIGGKETEFKATGDPIKPMLRISPNNKLQVTYDEGKHYENLGDNPVYTEFRFNSDTNTYLLSTDLGKTWTDISDEKVFYNFRTYNNKLLVSTDLGNTWQDTSEYIAAWFRWVDADGNGNLGKILISRDNNTWEDMTPNFVNNLYIKGYVATVGDLPTSTAALGDIYMVGPTYDDSDTNHDYPHYRMWVKLTDGWVDNGEYYNNIILAQTTGLDSAITMSQKAITETIKQETDRAMAAEEANATSIIDTDRIADGAVTLDKLQEPIKDVAEDVSYVDSPEFIRFYTDADGRLLWWINSDGSVDWASGVPQPVRDEIQRLEKLIFDNTESDDSVKRIIEQINDRIDSINTHINETLGYEDTDEYIRILKDSENRVLNAIESDGTNFIPKANIEDFHLSGIMVDNEAVISNTYIDGENLASCTLDQENRIIEAINEDGTKFIHKLESCDIDAQRLALNGEKIDNEGIKSNTYKDSEEYIRTELDSDGRVLAYTNADGSHYIHNLESETIPTEFESIEDSEDRIEIKEDADKRILSYRDSNGKLHENVGIDTPLIDTQNLNADKIDAGIINLSQVGLNEFEQALKANGFKDGQGDWSGASSLQIPEPRCAIMNITSADGNPCSWPTSKFANNKVWVEFYDMQGNYFKKRAIHNAQGSSSMSFIKKNGAFDLCNDEWIGDDTFSVKFGDWVYQDSFHAKAYYTDFFKGISVIAYKIADQVEKSRGIFNDRPWKKALLNNYVFGTDQTNSAQINDLGLQMNNEAKCHPDGFPCVMFLDGSFYGIYAFCLKKHRDNMHQVKDIAEHIHLDGVLNKSTVFNGTVDWTQFEIRNPKNLYYKEAQDGTFEYNADVAQAEIAGDDEVNAWIEAGELPDGSTISSKVKKRLQMTAKVKKYILALSQYIPQINETETSEDKKTLFEKYFDVDNLVDYEITQMATGDTDGFSKNWQWTTYDGVKWWVNEYDKDMSFGGHFTGMYTSAAPTTGGWMGNDIGQPIGILLSLYEKEIKDRWKYMVESGIFSHENFLNIINDWTNRIGTYFYEKEYEKWQEAPCNRDDGVDYLHWKRTNETQSITSGITYDDSKTYTEGETCWYGFDRIVKFECVATTVGNPPLTKAYNVYPKTLGYRDSIWRLVNYINKRLEVVNNFFNSLTI